MPPSGAVSPGGRRRLLRGAGLAAAVASPAVLAQKARQARQEARKPEPIV